MATTASQLALEIVTVDRKRVRQMFKILIEEKAVENEWDPKNLTRPQVEEILKDFRESVDEGVESRKTQ